MKSNEFLKLISSPLMNLDHTYRYSGTKLVEPESLSQHIVDTIMLGIKIIDEINARSEATPYFLSTEKYLMKAFYHDLEEVITGDIPRPLKYHDEDTLSSMRNVADEVAESLFKNQFHDWIYHYKLWSESKDDKEGYILKIVDNLVVVNKVAKEVSLLNNYYMLRVAHEVICYTTELRDHMSEYVEGWEPEVVDYLESLISDAIESMKIILETHKSDFDITSHSMI